MKATAMAIVLSLAAIGPALAASFVYVSNAEDGEIGVYTLEADGSLLPGPRAKAAKLVMPMAVSPDKRFLIAGVRSKPFEAYTYSIDESSGALSLVGKGPLAESFAYISLDRSGHFLFGASYGAHLVSVNAVAGDGRVGATRQILPTARNAHAIVVDNANRYVFVPHLGTDQVFQFVFDEKSGTLAANTPPFVQLKEGTGPRHLVVSRDNRFVYVLNELSGTVTTLTLDGGAGTLRERDSISILPPDTILRPGMPRGGPGLARRNTDGDIWASDLHLTPDGRFLYAAERTSGTLAGFRVDPKSGKLTYLGSTQTERQPRGFAIDPAGRFVVASGEKSDLIATYAIDREDGSLKPIGRFPTGRGSNWVEIVAFD